MSTYRICKYCSQRFDIDKEPYEHIGNRYAHAECHEKFLMLSEVKEKIHKMMANLTPLYNPARINNEIKKFKDQGLDEEIIYKTLVYWYDVTKHTAERSYGGIGIVPYVYKEAVEYFNKIEQAQRDNANVNMEDYVPIEKDTYIVKPIPIKKPKRLQLFELQ